MDKDEAERKIKEAAAAGNIFMSPSDQIEPYLPRLYTLLEKIDACEEPSLGFFSDESALDDFGDGDALALRIRKIYGVACQPSDTLLEIIKRVSDGQ